MKDTIDMAAGVKSGATVDNDSFSFLTPKESEKANTELQKMLNAVCSFAHEECAKLLANVSALDTASATQVEFFFLHSCISKSWCFRLVGLGK